MTQIRSLDGTVHKKSLAEEIDPEEKDGDGELTIESSKVVVAEAQGVSLTVGFKPDLRLQKLLELWHLLSVIRYAY